MSVSVNDGGIEKEVKMIYANVDGIDKLVAGAGDLPIIGEPFEGGLYAGFGFLDGIIQAFIVADISSEVSLRYGPLSDDVPGATSLYDGWANTQALNDPVYDAAYYCLSYRGGGFDDWFLAAPYQWHAIQGSVLAGNFYSRNRRIATVGGDQRLNGRYTSSAQANASSAVAVNVSNTSASSTDVGKQTTNNIVRPIRAITVGEY